METREQIVETLNDLWDSTGPEVVLSALADLLESREMPHLCEMIRRLAAGMARKDVVRVSTNLPEEDFQLLKDLASSLNITMTDVIRRGIRDEEFFRKVQKENNEVFVRTKDGSLTKVIQK